MRRGQADKERVGDGGGKCHSFAATRRRERYHVGVAGVPTVDELIILETPRFKRWVKKNKLTSAVAALSDELQADRTAGDVIPGGGGLRKVRMAGLGWGKQGGFRVIYVLLLNQTTAVLVSGYSKSEKEDLSADELKQLVAEVAALSPSEE